MQLSLEERITSFSKLGEVMQWLASGKIRNEQVALKSDWITIYRETKEKSTQLNPWFTDYFIDSALNSIALSLKEQNIRVWLSHYPNIRHNPGGKRIGVIMAGNIPLVGFHDFISILITGNYIIAKTSSKEGNLMQLIADMLIEIESEFQTFISFDPAELKDIDALIATGSNNTARYFRYEYQNLPSLIRKNRNGVTILDGGESLAGLEGLADDIFMYFGLGCRNTSKLYIPEAYNFNLLLEAINKYKDIALHKAYMNNYIYQSALYKMDKLEVIDNGFIILKKANEISSPISVLYFQYYHSLKEVDDILDFNRDKIQCVTGGNVSNIVPFGKSQHPDLWDYSDNLDTINFLISIQK